MRKSVFAHIAAARASVDTSEQRFSWVFDVKVGDLPAKFLQAESRAYISWFYAILLDDRALSKRVFSRGRECRECRMIVRIDNLPTTRWIFYSRTLWAVQVHVNAIHRRGWFSSHKCEAWFFHEAISTRRTCKRAARRVAHNAADCTDRKRKVLIARDCFNLIKRTPDERASSFRIRSRSVLIAKYGGSAGHFNYLHGN